MLIDERLRAPVVSAGHGTDHPTTHILEVLSDGRRDAAWSEDAPAHGGRWCGHGPILPVAQVG